MKIKRPLFIVALSMLVAIYMINTMPGSMLFACLALFFLIAGVHIFTKNKFTQHIILILLAAIMAAGYLCYYNLSLESKLEKMEGVGDTVITGTVVEKNISLSSVNYTVALNSFDNEKIHSFKVKVYTGVLLEPGDIVEIHGKYKTFTPTSDYIYNYSNNIYGYFYADDIEICIDESTALSFFMNVRNNLVDRSRKIFHYKTVGLAVAMGLGDKSLLDAKTVNDFTFTGLSHALVVSGRHVGFIIAALNLILYYVPIKKKLKNIVLSIFIFFFMGLIGFTPSIIRAGFLIIAILLGKNMFLEIDNYTVLAVIIILTLISNPYSAHSGSLLLSYSAYFGVIKRFEISADKDYNSITAAFLASVFAVVYTSPVIALLGMLTTFVAPLFNLILSPVIMAICVLSFFLPFISYIPFAGDLICDIMGPVNDALILIMQAVTPMGEKYFSFALVRLGAEHIRLFIFFAILAMIISYIQFDNKRVKIMFTIIVPLTVVLCYNYMNKDVVTVKVFDGSSEPSYVISHDDKNYLVATENINHVSFAYSIGSMNIEKFDEIIYCGKKVVDRELYEQYTEKLTDLSDKNAYKNELFNIGIDVYKKRKSYIIDVNNVKIGFNHNKADMSREKLDLYFFGSATPRAVDADNSFYFYPVIKKNVDLVTEMQATELYDILTFKIKLSTGRYYIIKDVKNFGSRI